MVNNYLAGELNTMTRRTRVKHRGNQSAVAPLRADGTSYTVVGIRKFTRKFGGKTYRVDSRSRTKKEALEILEWRKRQGHTRMRLVRVNAGDKWVLYEEV